MVFLPLFHQKGGIFVHYVYAGKEMSFLSIFFRGTFSFVMIYNETAAKLQLDSQDRAMVVSDFFSLYLELFEVEGGVSVHFRSPLFQGFGLCDIHGKRRHNPFHTVVVLVVTRIILD